MPEPAPNPELLRSLGRLARGLSALFWGLPAALVVCVGTASAGWFRPFGIIPPLVVTGLLCVGLWYLGAFQKQERPWRNALDRAQLFALVNFGLSPFLFWWNHMPGQKFFLSAVWVLGLSAVLFLFNLNVVLRRLGAMLPDETLRLETRHFTALNRTLLIVLLVVAAILAGLARFSDFGFHSDLLPLEFAVPAIGRRFSSFWLMWLAICLLALLPLAMTMALIWKTKEVILDSVFGAK